MTYILLRASFIRFRFADECGRTTLQVTDEAQLLTYPHRGNNYINNQVCSWNLISSNSTSRIRITFVRFATERNHDTLTVSCHFNYFESDQSKLPQYGCSSTASCFHSNNDLSTSFYSIGK